MRWGWLETETLLELLGGLVKKSMINAERQQQQETRYRLLETVRQYAREKLYDSGESEDVRNQHLGYFVDFCEEAYPHIHGAGRLEWTPRLKREYDNIREAMDWAFHDQTLAVQGLRIAVTLFDRFWVSTGMHVEGSGWLETGLKIAGEAIPKLLKAQVFCGLSQIHPDQSAPKRAVEQCVALCREIGPQADQILSKVLIWDAFNKNIFEYLPQAEEALRIARSLGPDGAWGLGEVLYFYAHLLMTHPDGVYDEQALAAAEESLAVYRAGDRWDVRGYFTIGTIQALRKQYEPARQRFAKALEVFREVDDFIGVSVSLFLLSLVYRLAGNYQLAIETGRETYSFIIKWNYDIFLNEYNYSFAMLLISGLNDGYHSWDATLAMQAVRLYSATGKGRDTQGYWYQRFKPFDLPQLEQLRQRLGEALYTQAWKEGEVLTLEQALALAQEIQRNASFGEKS